MAGLLIDDILQCLDELAAAEIGKSSSGGAGGGDAGGGSSGGGSRWPQAWLLLDLQQLLPPNSSLSQPLHSNIGQLAWHMEEAGRDAQFACHRAGALLAEIAGDIWSTQQLVALLQINDDMLALCQAVLQMAVRAGQRTAVPAVISEEAWKVLRQAAAKLDCTAHCTLCSLSRVNSAAATEEQPLEQFGKAAQGALRALQVAAKLSSCSAGNFEWALEQHVDSIAAVLQGAEEAARCGCLSTAGKDSLSWLRTWWAELISLPLGQPWRHCANQQTALGITGKRVQG